MESELEKPVLRRPLTGLALCFVVGVWCGLALHAPLHVLLGLLAAGLVVYSGCDYLAHGLLRNKNDFRGPCVRLGLLASAVLLVNAMLAGWALAVLQVHEPAGLLPRNFMRKPQEGVEVVGVVADAPAVRSYADGQGGAWRFTLELEGIRRCKEWQPAKGRVYAVVRAMPEDGIPPRYGERWQMFGVLTDLSRYLRTEPDQIRPCYLWVGRQLGFRGLASNAWCMETKQGNPCMAIVHSLRSKGCRLLLLGLDEHPEVSGLLQALLLGSRQELSARLREAFMATGTFHVLAISGQHVMLVSGFLIFLLQAYGFSRVRWFWWLAPVLIFYTLITGMSASAMRGCIMALVFYAGPWCMRKPDTPSSLALAGILILALDPTQLVNRGFILSFTAVAGLTLLYPGFAGHAAKLIEPDRFRIKPEHGFVRFLRSVASFVVQLIAASLAAWLATAPLGARWFHIVSPIGIVANLLVVPAISLVLGLGLIALVAGSVAPVFALICNKVNLVVVGLMVKGVDGLAKIPFGHFFVSAPPWWFVALWYVAILAWLVRKSCPRKWMLAPVTLIVVGSVLICWEQSQTMLEVWHPGQRPVVHVRTPCHGRWLVDTGPRFQANVLSSLLRERGVNRLNAVFFTRMTALHAGAADAGLGAIRIGGFAAPSGAFQRSPTWRAVDALAQDRHVPFLELNDAGEDVCGSDVIWEILYPPANADARGEEAVMVLRLTCNGMVALVRGDANANVEKTLLHNPDKLRADVLVLLDPAAAAACSSGFLDAVSPGQVVAAGWPPVCLLAKPDLKVEGLAPGNGIRFVRRLSGLHVLRWRLTEL